MAAGILDRRPFVVSGDDDSGVRLWDTDYGTPLATLHWDRGPWSRRSGINAVAAGVVDGRATVIAGGGGIDPGESSWGGIMRWDALTAQRIGTSLGREYVKALALGTIDGQPIIVAGGWDVISFMDGSTSHGHVHLWNVSTGKPFGTKIGHGSWVEAVAVGMVGGRPAVVSGAGNTVCLWDARTGALLSDPLEHEAVSGVALGQVDRRPTIVSAGRGLRLWDAGTGQSLGEPIRRDLQFESVAIGSVGDESVIVSSGTGGTVHLWRDNIPQVLTTGSEGVTAVAIVQDGVALGTFTSVLVVDVPGLRSA